MRGGHNPACLLILLIRLKKHKHGFGMNYAFTALNKVRKNNKLICQDLWTKTIQETYLHWLHVKLGTHGNIGSHFLINSFYYDAHVAKYFVLCFSIF